MNIEKPGILNRPLFYEDWVPLWGIGAALLFI
jgi:hypothetical protein